MLYIVLEPERLGKNFWQDAMPALSVLRREKVLRFRFNRDKVLSAVAFLLLRFGLYQEYGMDALPVCTYGPYGKPVLQNGKAHFSISHCHHAVACAMDTEALGADVEHWSAFTPDVLETLTSVFSPEEWQTIHTAPDAAQAACALWTAKESVCKYTGEGIRDDLPSILGRPDIRIDAYRLGDVSAAVCRCAQPKQPLPCREVHHDEILTFLCRCLTTGAVEFPHGGT